MQPFCMRTFSASSFIAVGAVALVTMSAGSAHAIEPPTSGSELTLTQRLGNALSGSEGMVRPRYSRVPDCAAPMEANPYVSRINLRLGAAFNPSIQFAGGFDFPVPAVRISPDFSGRVDLETFIRTYSTSGPGFTANGTEAYVALTLNQVYTRASSAGHNVYGGFGVGGVVGLDYKLSSPSVLTGKVFLGTAFSSRSSAELSGHFFNTGTRVSLQVRFGL